MLSARPSVIIVSWNVRERLRACLTSLARERASGAPVEVIVVDNASADGSAAMVREQFPEVSLLALPENRGFAAACNLGAAQAHGDVLVFLNHDAEVGAGFFTELAQAVHRHPRAAALGGRITYEAGTLQPSVRGFPSLWSSCLDAAKLLQRLPWLAPRYLARGFDYGREQTVPQVMGACLAVPREAWEQLKGFDEQYFTWFEEVDFCKRAQGTGYEVWYVPAITLRHVGGASFRQLAPLARHRLFTHSLRRYTRKHLGLPTWAVVTIAAVFGYLPALVAVGIARWQRAGAAGKFAVVLGGCAALDVLSWYAWHQPLLGNVATLAVAAAWLVVSLRDLALGVALLVVELVLGSQGYLLSLRLGDTLLSLRFVLFVAAFAVLVWRFITRRKLTWRTHPLFLAYLGALAAIAWGVAVALGRGNSFANIFLDVNGYFYLGLFPLFVEAAGERLWRCWQTLGYPALVWLGLKTLGGLYLFSHFTPDALLLFYQWWRQTGFGEITYVSGNIFRLFAQSQVYGALAAAVAFAVLARQLRLGQGIARHPARLVFLLAVATTTLASLSRSFWLGVVVAWGAALTALLVARAGRAALRYLLVSVVTLAAAAGLFFATTRLPWPVPPLGAAEVRILAERLQGEAASASRLRLLPPLWQAVRQHPFAGSGWGATVTYLSLDPRLVRSSAGGTGLTTTYAFEWGYLDTLLKLGFVAGGLFLVFLVAAAWYVLRRAPELGGALLALAVLNATTPYLNHPLGFGAVMLAVALAASHASPAPHSSLW